MKFHSLVIVVTDDMSAEFTPISWQSNNTYRGVVFPQVSVSSETDHTLATPVVSPVNIILESVEQHIIDIASSCAVIVL